MLPHTSDVVTWPAAPAARFDGKLREFGLVLERGPAEVVQINLGKVCNQACHHCHVGAGPKRTESMSAASLEAVCCVIDRDDIRTVDITGGAPELHPAFEQLVIRLRADGRRVMVRTNLTIMEEAGFTHLPEFYAGQGVELVASLPCYQQKNVDAQRGKGVFAVSVRALRRLNAVGYGLPDSGLELSLVFNPRGAVLPPPQAGLEADYRRELVNAYGIRFTRLFTITNMPIGRFRDDLERHGELEEYFRLLEATFNAGTVAQLMCRRTLNVGWDGVLYDCDFNAMLDMPMLGRHRRPLTIADLAADDRPGGAIAAGDHCLGCTAGAGSSCSGALA